MLLAELVATADAVAATGSRNAKIAHLADLLRRLEPDEIAPVVGFLSGDVRQGKVGVGWATAWRVEVSPAAEPSLTVGELDDALTRIQATVGAGSSAARGEILTALFARATEAETGYIRRVLVGDLRLGALAGVMIAAIAKAADLPDAVVRRAIMLSGDLCETATIAVTDGRAGLEAIGLRLFRPVQPMLASPAEDIDAAIATVGRASVEWKLDGVRIQVHREGDEVRVYTRNLNDITERVPEVADVVRGFPCSSVVLDGEALGLSDEERPHAFQDTMSRVGRSKGERAFELVPWFFDVMHLDGADLLDAPLGERAKLLTDLAGRWRIPAVVTDDAAEAARIYAEAVAAGHEGVMVKAAGSPYEAGKRGKAWLKVKRVQTLDLVVLGAEWGHGRRRGWLSNLHLGARDPAGGFVMVGKTFKGLTDAMLRWQTERFLQMETEREGIVVRIRPELVVEIELEGVQTSPRYAGGVALRFARVLRYREDKDPSQADTIDQVRALLAR